MSSRKKVLIIGGGLGGLSTGCYAQMNGYESEIFEMHEIPGGCCTAWERRKKYTFDCCISWLLGSGPGNEMHQIWLELGAIQGKEIRNFEIFNTIEHPDGRKIHFYSNPDKLYSHLMEVAPKDEKIIKEFCEGIRKFQKCLAVYPFLKPVGLMGFWERSLMMAKFLPYFNVIRKSISMLMTDFSAQCQDPFLREAFNFIFFEKMPNFPVLPFYFNLASHANASAGVPEHGSLGLANSIAARYESLAGKIHYNKKVETILVENDKAIGVAFADGSQEFADIIVSACDGYTTYYKMLKGQYLSETYERLYSKTINEKEMIFPGYFILFLGLNKAWSEFDRCSSHLLSEDECKQLVGITHPSINVQLRSDYYPELVPEGQSVLYITYFCDIDPWRVLNEDRSESREVQRKDKTYYTKHVKRSKAYHSTKKDVSRFLIDYLDKKHPGLKDSIDCMDTSTPMTQVRYTGNYNGTVLGWQPFVDGGETLEEEVKKNGVGLPGLENFYLSGVWATTGGLIRAAAAGRHVTQFICKDDNKDFVASLPTESL
ncbi:MAG: NAD(P)/FAD-dependent oxidoreductase [Methylococcales bacterium]|nr:NAD(P)/FAD-dependent oxidoreductase [Methylococcales bacterium]